MDRAPGARRLALVLTTGCFLVAAGCTAEQPRESASRSDTAPATAASPDASDALDDAADKVQEVAHNWVESSTVPGTAVLLRYGNEVSEVAEGSRDTQAPLRVDTPFAVASLTKMIVATATMRLRDRGLLALDDAVQRWLPGLLPARPEITVEQLLEHSSGLFNITDDPSFRPEDQTPEELVAESLSHGLQFRPGARLEYSNTGYLVLGRVLEEASGRPLDELLRREVFDPAGMGETSLVTRYPSRAVRGYEDGKDVTLERFDAVWAAGAVVSTLPDLDAFLQNLFNGDLVSRRSLDLMLEAERMVVGFENYGLGVAAIDTRCGTAYGHGGSLPGITTGMWTIPDSDRSVVIVVNTDSVHAPMEELIDTGLCG